MILIKKIWIFISFSFFLFFVTFECLPLCNEYDNNKRRREEEEEEEEKEEEEEEEGVEEEGKNKYRGDT